MLVITFLIVIGVTVLAIVFRDHASRWAGLLQGVALQMCAVVPVVIAQITGYAWKSWSFGEINDFEELLEYIGVWFTSILFDMGGWTVVQTFEWLVPKRQSTVFSNLGEFGVLWITKVLIVAGLLAWRRQHRKSMLDWLTILMLLFLLLDAWSAREFPWWGT